MSSRPLQPAGVWLLASVLLATSCAPAPLGAPPAPPDLSAIAVSAAPASFAATPEGARLARLGRLVEATITATHAHHILLARRHGEGDTACYGGGARADGDLEALVQHQRAVFTTDPAVLKAWAEGQPGFDEPAKHIDAILASGLTVPERTPAQVIVAYLREKSQSPLQQLYAIAGLWQIVLEIDRDGDILQDVFDRYVVLGLPVYVGELKLPGSDVDFLAMGRELAPKICSAPYDTAPEAIQIAGRKLWNWAERKLHIRDAVVLAGELVEEPKVQAILPRLRALPPQKIATVGHSFTLELHWASPATFVQIVGAVLARENPKTELKQWAAGGLTATKAEKRYLEEIVAWRPDRVLLVVLTRTDEDFAALERIGTALRAANIKGSVFDDVLDGVTREKPDLATKAARVARSAGLEMIEVKAMLDAAPDKGSFLCLDGIHMKEPYHRLMAREWLMLLSGARGLKP